jgi:nucleotide-binding universal stress UspA family protein
MHHPTGVLIAIGFLATLSFTLAWMLRLPTSLPRGAAHAVYSVSAAHSILVPILDQLQSQRAVELACRMGRPQGASIVLAYIIEVPMLLALDTTLPSEVEERAQGVLAEAEQIVERNRAVAIKTMVRARKADEGIRRAVRAYKSDLVVLGVEASEGRASNLLTRTAEGLLSRLPCEVIVDVVPESGGVKLARDDA